jgi:hypothetical protein
LFDPKLPLGAIPSGDGVRPAVQVDLDALADADLRMKEISTVNPHKAPELRAALGLAWSKTRDIVAQLIWEQSVARNEAVRAQRRALLASAGGSADIRKAHADLDPLVIAAEDRLAVISAAVVWLDDKARAYRHGYFDVARAAGEAASPPVTPLTAAPETIVTTAARIVPPSTQRPASDSAPPPQLSRQTRVLPPL